MALDNFSSVNPDLPADVYQEISELKQEISRLARTLDSVMEILGSRTVFRGDDGGLFSKVVTENGFAGITVRNAAGSRRAELLYIGTARAAAYGANPGESVLNAQGALTLSLNDTRQLQILPNRLISWARFDVYPPAGQVFGVWDSVGAVESYLQLSVNGAIYGYLGNGGGLGGSAGRMTVRGEQGVALNLSGTSVLTVQSNGSVVTLLTAAGGSLSDNSSFTCALTSNTNLRFLVRGTDGVTRQANLALT